MSSSSFARSAATRSSWPAWLPISVSNLIFVISSNMGSKLQPSRDATAGSKLPEGDAYYAALVNFRWFANALWTTDATIEKLKAARRS